MVGFNIFASRRVRSTPYTGRVELSGLSSYTVYNHMLMGGSFESLESDCIHLKEHVQLWDVSCERQVELVGRDARELAVMMSVRDLSVAEVGRCYYAPVTDGSGGMINDPVALCLGEDRFWFSIADSDMILWAKGLAEGFGLEVDIFEPDVSPLAVQGLKSESLMVDIFGDGIRDLGFFRFGYFAWRGRELLIARSGWSKQGGFEIYLDDGSLGETLWDDIWSCGGSYNLRAGCPNLIERIEGGLLSYGNDMTLLDTPLECGLDRYVSLDCDHDYIGKSALLAQRAEGLTKRLRGVRFGGDKVWGLPSVLRCRYGGEDIGYVSSAVWSLTFGINLGFAMLRGDAMYGDISIEVFIGGEWRCAEVCDFPFK